MAASEQPCVPAKALPRCHTVLGGQARPALGPRAPAFRWFPRVLRRGSWSGKACLSLRRVAGILIHFYGTTLIVSLLTSFSLLSFKTPGRLGV